MIRIASLLILLVATSCLQIDESHVAVETVLFDGTGSRSRQIQTKSPMAQKYADQGLAFLYAYNHVEAIRSFEQCLKFDSTCAFAYWGIAYALGPHINFPVVSPDDAKRAYAASQRAAQLSSDETKPNQALIQALVARYPETQPEDRTPFDSAYAKAMITVREKFPDDADIGALTAEALMNLRPWDQWQRDGTPQPGTELVLQILESTIALDSVHPLALHLMIHATEASHQPQRALAAADRLGGLAPGLGHLVHMPSHTYVRTGDWQKAVESNRKAMTADSIYRTRSAGQTFYRIYMAHNYHMRAFACMMTGRGQETIDVLDRMVADIPDSFRVEWAWAIDGFFAMPLEARMRFGRWDEILAYPDMPEGLPLSTALRHYARGVAFAAQNNVVAARAEQRLFTEAAAKVGPEISFGNNTGPGVIEIARHVLAGEILFRSGKHEEGIAELKLAIAAEDALRYDEPPSWIQPCRHVLGAFYMSIGRFSDAEAVYREDLKILPDNGWSLYGLARSLELQERPGGDGYRKKFERIWKDADLSITSSCLCLP